MLDISDIKPVRGGLDVERGKMVNMAGRRPGGGVERRFTDVVKENIKLVGVRERRAQRIK